MLFLEALDEYLVHSIARGYIAAKAMKKQEECIR